MPLFEVRLTQEAQLGPFFRELLISFGGSGYGYLALFEITNATHVTVLALRHQREDDYH